MHYMCKNNNGRLICTPFLLLSLLLIPTTFSATNMIPTPLMGFTGNWDEVTTTLASIPNFASDGSCTLSGVGTSTYKYTYFNISFVNGNGVRRLSSFQDFSYVFAYENGFYPSNPCQVGTLRKCIYTFTHGSNTLCKFV